MVELERMESKDECSEKNRLSLVPGTETKLRSSWVAQTQMEPSKPRILLEVLSPSGTRLVFFLLYGAFAFAIWLGRVSRLTESAKKTCVARASVVNDTVRWRGELTNLGELFGSVALEGRFPNGTNATAGDETVGYAIWVEASQKKKNSKKWSDVLSLAKETATVRSSDADFGRSTFITQGDDPPPEASWSSSYGVLRSARLASWYQNMEAAPSRSRVHAYSVTIDFCTTLQDDDDLLDDDPAAGVVKTMSAGGSSRCPLVSPGLREALEMGGELRAAYDDVSRLETLGAKLARFGLVAAWLVITAAWLPQATAKRREAYARRKQGRSPSFAGGAFTAADVVADDNDRAGFARLLVLVISLLLFIDPIDCCIQFAPHDADVPPVVAFLSFASRRFGEGGLLAALLLMADGDGTAADRIRRCVELTKQRAVVGDDPPGPRRRRAPHLDEEAFEGNYKPPLNATLPSEVDYDPHDDDVATEEDEDERRHRLAVSVVRVARQRHQRLHDEEEEKIKEEPLLRETTTTRASRSDSELEDLLDFFEEQQQQQRGAPPSSSLASWLLSSASGGQQRRHHQENQENDDNDARSSAAISNAARSSAARSSEGSSSARAARAEWRRRRRWWERCKRVVRRQWWVVFPTLYVFCSVMALGLRFPSLWGLDRAPTLALASWPTSALMQFVGFSLVVVVSVVTWAAFFVGLLWRAARRLEAAPYLLTRRHQLAYRFFVLQSFLVAGVAIASYAALVVKLVSRYRQSIATVTGTDHKRSFRRAVRDLASALEALVADDVRDLASAFFFLHLRRPPLLLKSAAPSGKPLRRGRRRGEVGLRELLRRRRRDRRPDLPPALPPPGGDVSSRPRPSRAERRRGPRPRPRRLRGALRHDRAQRRQKTPRMAPRRPRPRRHTRKRPRLPRRTPGLLRRRYRAMARQGRRRGLLRLRRQTRFFLVGSQAFPAVVVFRLCFGSS